MLWHPCYGAPCCPLLCHRADRSCRLASRSVEDVNPWYLALVGKSMKAWVPEATPVFEPYLRDAFLAGYRDRSATSEALNALYSTLLNVSGVPCDRFNLSDKMAAKFDAGTGPLKEILV